MRSEQESLRAKMEALVDEQIDKGRRYVDEHIDKVVNKVRKAKKMVLEWKVHQRMHAMTRTRFVTHRGLEHLRNYSYASGSYGQLDKVMNHYWNWLVTFVPESVAPNVLTMCSLLHMALAASLFWYYCPRMDTAAPSWVYFVAVYCVFAYQSFDAIDGKQARRTGSSSPLGQLFDHGCDALGTFLVSTVVCSVIQTGPTWQTVGVAALHYVPFWTANWEESHTHVFRFGMLGVTEAQYLIMSMIGLSGVYGPQIWHEMVPYLNVQWRTAVVGFTLAGAIYQVLESMWIVTSKYRENNDSVGLRIALWQQAQFLIVIALGMAWMFSPTALFYEYPRLMLSVMGLLFSYLVSRLIISSVTNMRFPSWHALATPLPLFVINSFVRHVNGWAFCERVLLKWYVGIIAVVYVHYVYNVVFEICDYLDIYCFSIKPVLHTVDADVIETMLGVEHEQQQGDSSDDDDDDDDDDSESSEAHETTPMPTRRSLRRRR
eukprot:TRINITY_DN30431_c0_g1_i1.p1 TRINITY_DN30431_c0_g1~~TRINITY_DN30431_c0_g1_i1.p1  ORF type:complete len:488 (-),score=232.36 TRINITY_DN30431_c0_g1_i1:139-1602(-)